MLVTMVEVGIDVEGLEKHLHCSKAEVLLRLSKGPESFAREVAKNPTFFHFYGSVDLDDLTEPASFAKYVKEQFAQLNKRIDAALADEPSSGN